LQWGCLIRKLQYFKTLRHARAYKVHAITTKGLRNISHLRCFIFKIKTDDKANPPFSTVCCFNGLQQSHAEFNTNTRMCQPYRNAMFCFSNTHNTNSQQMTSVISSSAQVQHVQLALHVASLRNCWLAPCILHKEHLNFKIIPPKDMKS